MDSKNDGIDCSQLLMVGKQKSASNKWCRTPTPNQFLQAPFPTKSISYKTISYKLNSEWWACQKDPLTPMDSKNDGIDCSQLLMVGK
jgi:hypothetical protein